MRSPKPYKAADGTTTWRVRYRLGDKETSETFRRKVDADTFAAILGDGRDDRVTEALAWVAARDKSSDTITFAEWFDQWAAQLSGITSRTLADYHAMHRRYLTDLDHLPLPLVSRAHVAGIVNTLDRQGLSPKTIKNVVHMLASVMRMAQEDGLIPRNPVRRVRLPKARLDEHTIRFLTHAEVAALIANTPIHYQPLIAFLVGTGLRWSEATALQARHVDLERGTVRVERAWKRVPGGWELGPPKSVKARRTVNAGTLALVTVAPLLGKPNDLVFTTKGGAVVRHSNFYTRVWQPAVKAAGIEPPPTPHSLRHTHASWLLSDGQPIEAVQDQLGHESYETTRKVYAHLLPAVGVAVGRSASEAMRQVLALAASDGGGSVAELVQRA